MMDYETQLKLQAYLDRELSGEEARRCEERLADDPEAQALLAELKSTAGALASFEDEVRLPESREFFWSKIQRELQRQPPLEAAPRVPWFFSVWRRWLVPAGAMAAAMMAVLLVARPEQGPEAETSLSDSGAFTYHDFAARTTLVWLSYPAEDEMIDSDAADLLD